MYTSFLKIDRGVFSLGLGRLMSFMQSQRIFIPSTRVLLEFEFSRVLISSSGWSSIYEDRNMSCSSYVKIVFSYMNVSIRDCCLDYRLVTLYLLEFTLLAIRGSW